MLRKLFVISVVGLFVVPTIAQAQFNPGDIEMTLSGGGVTNKGVSSTDNNGINVEVGLGYFLTKEFEVGVRQGVRYQDTDFLGTVWSGSTRGAVDFHFDLGQFQPFVGGTIGFIYSDFDTDTDVVDDEGDVDLDAISGDDYWVAGPEAGLKYFVNSTTFIFGMAEYQINLKDSDDSRFVYSLGIGFKF